MAGYRDLVVWKKAMDFVTDVYRFTAKYPAHEQFGIVQQMRRAAVSIPSNIAEGSGRTSRAEYIRFMHIARGSLYELRTQIDISFNLNYLDEARNAAVIGDLLDVERMLKKLISRLDAPSG
jgi:four helix bundle protein